MDLGWRGREALANQVPCSQPNHYCPLLEISHTSSILCIRKLKEVQAALRGPSPPCSCKFIYAGRITFSGLLLLLSIGRETLCRQLEILQETQGPADPLRKGIQSMPHATVTDGRPRPEN